jgi:hypothetical protein
MSEPKLILDHVYDHETTQPDKVYLTQPVGGAKVIDYTWAQVLDQARRMAAHLQGRGFERGARIAILSKNCAHFFMAELAIWMAGYTTVAIFPTETAKTVRYVLDHSEASLLFVGKLDTWPQQMSGVPAGLPCIAFPLAPRTEFDQWDAILARTDPLGGRPQRGADELAMLIYTSGSTGQPKGAMISFGAITRAGEGFSSYTSNRMGAETEVRLLSTCRWRTASSARALKRRRWSRAKRTSSLPRRSTPSCKTCNARGRRSSSRSHGCGSNSSRACSPRWRRRSSIACSASRSWAASSPRRSSRVWGWIRSALRPAGRHRSRPTSSPGTGAWG